MSILGLSKHLVMKGVAKQCAWETHLRGLGHRGCWNSGMISYGEIKYQMLEGIKCSWKFQTRSHVCCLKSTFLHTPSKGQEYCQWRYQRTYLLIFCLEVILYAWARNQVLSSLKEQTAGCRNAAEGISENTRGDRETQGERRSTSTPSITDKSESCYPQDTVLVLVSWHDSEQAGCPPIFPGKASGTLVNLE